MLANPNPGAKPPPASARKGFGTKTGTVNAPPGNPLLNPNQPLSGNALKQAATALTNAQLNGPLQELARQIAANNNQTTSNLKLAGGYYNALGNQVGQNVTDEGNISNALQTQLQGIAQGTNQRLTDIGNNAQNSLTAYSPGDASLRQAAQSSLASEIAKQQGLAAQQQGASQAFGATQGANYQGLASSGALSNSAAATAALKSISQSGDAKNLPLNEKVANLDASRGALQATNEGKLRQQEISNALTQQSLNNTLFGINSENTRSTNTINAENTRAQNALNAANTRAQNSIDAAAKQGTLNRQNRIDIAKINHAAVAAGKPPVYTPTGNRVLTPQAQQRIFDSVDAAKALIPQMQQPLTANAAKSLVAQGYNVKEGQKLSEAQIRHLLATGVHPGGTFKYTPAEIDSAYALAGYGGLTDKQVTELNKLGVIVGTRYRRIPAQISNPKISPGAANSPH